MTEDMQLRGLAPATQQAYLRYVEQLAIFTGKSPDFDDYHVVTDVRIHDAMTFLIDHLPPQVHVVITSRVDPPLPLARWRAHGMLTELRAAELGVWQRFQRFRATEHNHVAAECSKHSQPPTPLRLRPGCSRTFSLRLGEQFPCRAKPPSMGHQGVAPR
jgi:hypothetical protein